MFFSVLINNSSLLTCDQIQTRSQITSDINSCQAKLKNGCANKRKLGLYYLEINTSLPIQSGLLINEFFSWF